MPFDDKKYNAPVRGGDAGGVALDVSIALSAITRALHKLSVASGADIQQELKEIDAAREDVWEAFESMTGYDSTE